VINGYSDFHVAVISLEIHEKQIALRRERRSEIFNIPDS
jgi:hypothetical protein